VRGADLPRRRPQPGPGTIPAGAGNRRRGRPRSRGRGDHPRGCGEQTAVGLKTSRMSGPSPQVRGAANCGATRPH